MLNLIKSLADWHERTSLTVAEAAAVADRSTTWIHNRLTDGSLEGANVRGRMTVTVASLSELLIRCAAKRPTATPRPRLVWSNPNLK